MNEDWRHKYITLKGKYDAEVPALHARIQELERAVRPRRWLTIEQAAKEFPAFTSAAIRALIYRSRPHYNSRGEMVDGNGLVGAITQPGGKNSRVLIDAVGFASWLESWVGTAAAEASADADPKITPIGKRK
jgi:hypothetical protein